MRQADTDSSKGGKSLKKMIILLIFIMLMAMGYFGYYSYRSGKILFLKPEEFKVELETENITLAGMKWLESYAAQYEARYVK